MTTIQSMMNEADQRALIRKVQKAVAFIAPTTVELPESLFTGAGQLVDLQKEGWLPVGHVSPDGWNFGREIESEDVDALGYAAPRRTDVTRVVRSVTATLIESGRKHIQELMLGMSLDGVTQDPTTGEVVFEEPDLPVAADWRLIVIGGDGPADAQWILGRGFFRVQTTQTAEEVWGREGAVSRELTFSVFSDDVTGAPVRHYLGGTGAAAHVDALGYQGAEAGA